MNTADRAQYNVLLGMMKEAAERYGAADMDVRRAEAARERAAEALATYEQALDGFIDRLADGEEDDDDGPCMCIDCVRVRDKWGGA